MPSRIYRSAAGESQRYQLGARVSERDKTRQLGLALANQRTQAGDQEMNRMMWARGQRFNEREASMNRILNSIVNFANQFRQKQAIDAQARQQKGGTKGLFGLGGSAGGAALGAAFGTALFPGLGTAAGMLAGGALGGAAGGTIGSQVDAVFSGGVANPYAIPQTLSMFQPANLQGIQRGLDVQSPGYGQGYGTDPSHYGPQYLDNYYPKAAGPQGTPGPGASPADYSPAVLGAGGFGAKVSQATNAPGTTMPSPQMTPVQGAVSAMGGPEAYRPVQTDALAAASGQQAVFPHELYGPEGPYAEWWQNHNFENSKLG